MARSEDGRVIRSAALWGTILNVGGILLTTGTLGYAVLTIQAYEERCGPVDTCGSTQLTTTDMEEASPVPDAMDVNSVANTDTVAAEPPPDGTAGPQPDATVATELAEAKAALDQAKSELENAQASNEALKQRVATLEQAATQGPTDDGVSAEAAQCRSEMVQLRGRFNERVQGLQRTIRGLTDRLNECQARPAVG